MNTNGSNPYSFPPLSSNSPNVAEEEVAESDSSIPHRATISLVGEASRETQHHLQQTSAALDAAYNRIRQVRQRLLELSSSLPATMFQPHLQEPDGLPEPGHDADTFSMPQPSVAERYDARARAPWNRVRPRSQSTSDTPSPGSHSNPVGAQRSMNSGLGAPRDVFFTTMRNRLGNRDAQGDDGSTSLGRRVAARMTVPPVMGDTASATDQLMRGVRQFHEGSVNFTGSATRSHEEDLEHALHFMGERRRNFLTVPLQATQTRSFARISSRGHSRSFPQQSSQGISLSSSQALPNLSSQVDPGLGRVFSNQQYTSPAERLSRLSNRSMQNFAAISTGYSPSRPLIFDESPNYVSSEMVDPSIRSRYSPAPDFVPHGRNYVVHRHFDRNGEELVRNILVDWDESDPVPVLMPSANLPRRQGNFLSTPLDFPWTFEPVPPAPAPELPLPEATVSSNSTDETPQRRGWARLDPDGNEISLDEEEELERARTEHRILAAQRALAHGRMAQDAPMAPVPTTSPEPPELTIYQSINPPFILRHDPSLSYPDDFINPLPMPLSEMVDSRKIVERKPILLPRHIIIAGR